MIQFETYIVMDSIFSQKFPVDQEQRCMRQFENNTNKGFYKHSFVDGIDFVIKSHRA